MGLVVSTMGVWYFGSGTVDIGGLVLWVWYCRQWGSGTVDNGGLVLWVW